VYAGYGRMEKKETFDTKVKF